MKTKEEIAVLRERQRAASEKYDQACKEYALAKIGAAYDSAEFKIGTMANGGDHRGPYVTIKVDADPFSQSFEFKIDAFDFLKCPSRELQEAVKSLPLPAKLYVDQAFPPHVVQRIECAAAHRVRRSACRVARPGPQGEARSEQAVASEAQGDRGPGPDRGGPKNMRSVMFATNHDIGTRSKAECTTAYRPVEHSAPNFEVTTC